MLEDFIGKTISKIENRGNGISIEFEDKSKMTLYPLGTMRTDEGEELSGLAIYVMDEKGNTNMIHTTKKAKIQRDTDDT